MRGLLLHSLCTSFDAEMALLGAILPFILLVVAAGPQLPALQGRGTCEATTCAYAECQQALHF